MLFTALLILTAIWILAAGLAPWRRVAAEAARAAEEPEPLPDAATAPKVSVVSYVLRDEDSLSEYIDTLMRQDYPDMEIVLVCDASAEATSMISERFENVERLHITFIPPGSHNLSRRKLAQTVGIKAAKGDVVLLTSTSVAPVSESWVAGMVRPFALDPTTAMVLGYVRPVFADYTGGGKWYRQFDHLIDSTSWMDAALRDDPFRGDGYNLALRRELFFTNKGYASTIPLMDGDDDIFIREISAYGPVTLSLAPDSVEESRWGDQTDRRHIDLKDRRMFTRRYLPRRPFLMQGMLSLSQWLALIFTALGILSAIAGFCASRFGGAAPLPGGAGFYGLIIPESPETALATAAITAAAALALWGAEISAYRRLASALGAVRLFWAVIPFMLWRPIGNLLFNINHRTTRKSHFTWQR